MTAFDFAPLLAENLPPAAQRWSGYPKYNFIGGHNAREAIPVEALIAAATRQLSEKGRELATYNLEGGPQGMRQLRDVVAEKLRRDRQVACDPDQVVITSGSLQGLDLVNTLLLGPGDTVLIEEFTYGGMLSKIHRKGAKTIGMPLDAHGIRLDALEQILTDLQSKGISPKYLYTIPTVQNPTGSIMPLERREGLLALARRFGVPIFEDECYADLIWDGDWPPALRGLDDRGQVIHIGSFSKTLAPALRLGYLVADWAVISRLLPLKGDAGTGAIEQMVVADYFGSHFSAHVKALVPRLEAKLDLMIEAVSREFGTSASFERPKGGIFFWITLAEPVDTSVLYQAAIAEGVHFNAGAEWAADPANGTRHLRLCFALASETEINEGIAKLAEICHREFGVPVRSANVARD